MSTQQINRISTTALIALSTIAAFSIIVAASIAILGGQPPQRAQDEGVGAHIFQLSVVGAVFSALVFSSTANWRRSWTTARPLLIAVALLAIAFSTLYYFEHILGY
jgi:uncharacterized membrane protein YozB (DUF420 family)